MNWIWKGMVDHISRIFYDKWQNKPEKIYFVLDAFFFFSNSRSDFHLSL